MITFDSSALIALLDRNDEQHIVLSRFIAEHHGPLFIPAQVMAEIAWFVETRFGQHVLAAFLEDVETGEFTLDCGEQDIPRIRELVVKYADMPLGFADAAVIACAERNGGKVLTLDHRHFGVLARDAGIKILP